MPHQSEQLRERMTQAARRSRPHGLRQEERFPVRPEGLTDIDVRHGIVLDQTNEAVMGFGTIAGMTTGAP